MLRLKMGLDPKTVTVDKTNRRLNGVIAIEPIDIKDWRPFTINKEFIDDLVALANKQKGGVKSHWGHNYNNLGKIVGRATAWSVDADGKARYNLDIYSVADKSPGLNGLGTYILDLLEEDNAAIMTSIVFKEEYFYQLDGSGQKLKVYYVDNKSGEYIRPNPTLGKVYPKLSKLYSTDLVEEGAATNSMFSSDVEQSSSVMDEIRSFFSQLLGDHLSPSSITEVTGERTNPDIFNALNNQSPMADEIIPVVQVATQSLETPVETAQTAGPTVAQLQAENERLRQELANKPLTDEIATLKAKLAALEAEPAASPTIINSGEGGSSTEPTPLWAMNPINQEALALFSNTQNKA